MSEPHQIEERDTAGIGGVVEDLADGHAVDSLPQSREHERENLGGPARLDSGSVETHSARLASSFESCDDLGTHHARIDQVREHGRHDVLARLEDSTDVVEMGSRV